MIIGKPDIGNSRARANSIVNKQLTSDEFNDLLRVSNDPFEFSKFIYLIHQIRGKTKFDLYPYQKQVLWQFIHERFNIILKFRQAGLTELISMFCLWYASYHSNKFINIISIKDIVAKKVLRKIKYMYRNLPDHLKVQVVNGRTKDIGTASEMEFANGSVISSIPTTEEAGRSESLSILVIDEAAIVRWANSIWASAFPTLSTGGRAIVNSTPYGIGGFFHSTWVDACTGASVFNPIRLRWEMHPERDQLWYEQMKTALGRRRTAQEIDGDFLTSGNSVFDLMDIRAIEESLDMYPPLDIRKHTVFKNILKGVRPLGDNLLLFDLPDPKKRYTIGGDVSTGRAADYSTFTLSDDKGEEAGCYKGKIPPNELANLIGNVGKAFNYAVVAPESNDIGLAVAMKLQEDRYRNLYYSKKLVRKKKEKRPQEEEIPGWYTTKKNRPIILSELEEDIRTSGLTIKDPFFVQEAYTFIYDDRNRPVAMGKGNVSDADDMLADDSTYSDDTIMGKAINNHIRKIRKKGPIVLPV